MHSYYARACHVAQCVHVISIWVVYVTYIGTALRLCYMYAYFIRERGFESHCETAGMMESGGSFLYASCGGGFMQPITVRSL